MKLPIIWKHVLNDSSKAVETFPLKMAGFINNHYRIYFFSHPNVTPVQLFQPRKNDFELDYISTLKNAISYQRDFNLTKFSNAILNFVFILPAWILLISLCFPDVSVSSSLLPENRIDKLT